MSKQKLCMLIIMSTIFNAGCMREINRSLTRHEAKESYYSGNFARSFRLTEAMAYEGDVKAEYSLGYMYYYGIGAPENKPLGMAWIREAALKGYPPAVFAIKKIEHDPLISSKSEGAQMPMSPSDSHLAINEDSQLPKSPSNPKSALSVDELNKLALMGDKNAQYTLGYMYYYGKGILKNEELGLSLIKLSAENGNAKAVIAVNRLDEFTQALSHVQTVETEIASNPSQEIVNKPTQQEFEFTALNDQSVLSNKSVSNVPEVLTNKEVVLETQEQWIAQIFTFSLKENANKLLEKFKSQHIQAFAKEKTGKKGNLIIVYLGPANSKEAISQMIAQADEKYGIKDVIVRKDNVTQDKAFAFKSDSSNRISPLNQQPGQSFCKENVFTFKPKETVKSSSYINENQFNDTLT